MAAPVAIAVYSFAFLTLILYSVVVIVQGRHPRRRSWKYFSFQPILVLCIFVGEVVLVVYNEKEVKPAILHGLQALSLLLSLVIDAMMSSRLYLGKDPLLDFERHFLWVLFSTSLAVLALFWSAFGFILRGTHEERSLIFIAVATITAHSFPTCFSLGQLHILKAKIPTFVGVLNLVTLPALVAALLLPGVTEVLLGQSAIFFVSQTLWVSQMIYNLEIRKRYDKSSDEVSLRTTGSAGVWGDHLSLSNVNKYGRVAVNESHRRWAMVSA